MRYCPVPSVTAVRAFSMRAGLAASTSTPGTGAPEASLAEPLMAACANAGTGTQANQARNRNVFIGVPARHARDVKREAVIMLDQPPRSKAGSPCQFYRARLPVHSVPQGRRGQ